MCILPLPPICFPAPPRSPHGLEPLSLTSDRRASSLTHRHSWCLGERREWAAESIRDAATGCPVCRDRQKWHTVNVTNGGSSLAEWDFFVSYTAVDRPWAEWVAWQLEDADYRVLLQAWDFLPGSNWVGGMNDGVRRAARTIAILSNAYLRSVYGTAEWQAAWMADPAGAERKLLVVRVSDGDRPGLLGQVVSIDLFGRPQDSARAELLRAAKLAITGARAKPEAAPPFPPESTSSSNQISTGPSEGTIRIGSVSSPGGQAVGINYGHVTQPEGPGSR